MTQIESLYLQYYISISKEMTGNNSVFSLMVASLIEQFKNLGLTNEEKAKALVGVYTQEMQVIDTEASKAAIQLLRTGETNLTEIRKRQGYDDNVLIEIMKAQGGLASFAVNANSDSAQDTIDDLHVVMDKIEERVCDIVCNVPSFELSVTTEYDLPVVGNVYGGTGLTYTVTESPEKGTIEIADDGEFTYTPIDSTEGIGNFKAILHAKDEDNGFETATIVIINVTDVAHILTGA